MDLTELGGNIALGFNVALSLESLLYCFVGVSLGTFIGVLPGVGVMSTVALLMPLTFYLDPTSGLIMLAGIYYGAAYGGSTASILLNLPGTPQTAVTCLDGYPMTQQGRAGVALFTTTIASFAGSVIGLAALALLAPALAKFALRFGSEEYFSLMVLGLVAASLLSSGAPFRSLAMVCFGLMLGLVGIDVNSGQMRFTFGVPELFDGLSIVAVALGLFGLPEIISNVGKIRNPRISGGNFAMRDMFPSRKDWRRATPAILRGTGMGAFFGVLPGTGGLIASFMSYAAEKRISRNPQRFGKGAIEGVAGPEAANNAAIQTAFIPTLTLGIPGDALMALLLGVMLVHGVVPGPGLLTDNPDVFWGLTVSFLIGNLMLLVLNIPLIGIWVRILRIPYHVLYPAIIVFICIGVFSVRYSVVDIGIALCFGFIGYGMSLLRLQPAPLILGLVLGPLMEEHLRRALLISRGDPTTFLTHPISALFLGITALLVLSIVFRGLWSVYRNSNDKSTQTSRADHDGT